MNNWRARSHRISEGGTVFDRHLVQFWSGDYTPKDKSYNFNVLTFTDVFYADCRRVKNPKVKF